jgi:hypothetical protein
MHYSFNNQRPETYNTILQNKIKKLEDEVLELKRLINQTTSSSESNVDLESIETRLDTVENVIDLKEATFNNENKFYNEHYDMGMLMHNTLNDSFETRIS